MLARESASFWGENVIVVKYGICELFSLNSKTFKILSLVMKIREVVTSLIFTAEVELNYKINNESENKLIYYI